MKVKVQQRESNAAFGGRAFFYNAGIMTEEFSMRRGAQCLWSQEKEAVMANKMSMFVMGGLVGAGIALLYAPRKGAETRAMMTDRANLAWDQAQDMGDTVAARGQQAYDEAVAQGQRAYNQAAANVQAAYTEVTENAQAATAAAALVHSMFTPRLPRMRKALPRAPRKPLRLPSPCLPKRTTNCAPR